LEKTGWSRSFLPKAKCTDVWGITQVSRGMCWRIWAKDWTIVRS